MRWKIQHTEGFSKIFSLKFYNFEPLAFYVLVLCVCALTCKIFFCRDYK